MANNTFEIVGKLVMNKESEKFKPYESKVSDSGWVNNRLVCNAIAGDNRHMLDIKGGYAKDGNGKIFTFSKSGVSETGEKIKGEKLEIAWKDRMNTEVIDNVAEFKKFVIDLEEHGRRFKLEKALEKQKEGSLTEEELVELNVDDLAKAYDDSKKKRKEFISESDFVEFMYKLLSSEKIKDKMLKISGEIIYSEYNGKFYKRLAPQRIYLAEKDAVPSSTGQLTVFYNKESLDSNSLKEKKKHYINAFIRNYDSKRKSDIPCPVQLVIDTTKDEENEKAKKLNNLMVNQFTVSDKTWKEFGVKVKLLDGSQKAEITDDMLTDFQKEMLELEMITLDDIRKEIGGDVYGEKIQEMVIINAAKGYTKGSKPTVYIDNDFVIQELEISDKKEDKKTEEDDDDDIFGDIDI